MGAKASNWSAEAVGTESVGWEKLASDFVFRLRAPSNGNGRAGAGLTIFAAWSDGIKTSLGINGCIEEYGVPKAYILCMEFANGEYGVVEFGQRSTPH